MRVDEVMGRAFILVANAMSGQEAVGRMSAGRALRVMHKSTIPGVIRLAGPERCGLPACSSLRLYGRAHPPYEAACVKEPRKITFIFSGTKPTGDWPMISKSACFCGRSRVETFQAPTFLQNKANDGFINNFNEWAVGRMSASRDLKAMHKTTVPSAVRHAGSTTRAQPPTILQNKANDGFLCDFDNPPYEAACVPNSKKISVIFSSSKPTGDCSIISSP